MVGHVTMEGKEVFRHAVVNLAQAVDAALASTGISPDKIDWLVSPSSQFTYYRYDGTKNYICQKKKWWSTIDQHANTSAASIPLAINAAVRDGRIQKKSITSS